METRKANPSLVDEAAVQIIEQIDTDSSQLARNLDEITQIGWIQRSLVCDQVTRGFLTSYPEGTIVGGHAKVDATHPSCAIGLPCLPSAAF
jgi:hypothetical protein